MLELGGFSITYSQRNQMVAVVLAYSILVVGLGIFVKIKSKKHQDNKLADYLTGGGGLSSFEIAMFTVTSALAGGTMVGSPGLSYGFGLISILTVFTGFAMNLSIMGAIGRKIAIVNQRIHAVTPIQLLRHRFQSKSLAYILGISIILFGTAQASSNLMVAAKLFTAITGGSSYLFGLLLAVIAIVIYTMSGGVKSLARICVVQGVLMVGAVTVLCTKEYAAVFEQHGSIQAAMEYVAQIKPELMLADTWQPLYAFGFCMLYGWSCFAMPISIQSNLTYNSPKRFFRAIVVGTITTFVLHFAMTGSAMLTFSLNPNLTQPDYSVVYLATTMLPGVVAGFVIAGCFAAVQSTVATLLLIAASAVCKDLYQGCINPKVSDAKVAKLNVVFLIVLSAVAVMIGLYPSDFTQLLNTFAGGGMIIAFMMPIMFGLYSKRATPAGAVVSSLGGFLSYIGCYVLSKRMPALWGSVLGNVNPLLPAMLISLVLMILVSKFTRKVPLGICEVWFGEEYEERFCTEYNLH